jgi:hypothetical protein
VLEQHHDAVKTHELAQLQQQGASRVAANLEPEAAHIDSAITAVVGLTKGTVLESHYSDPEVQGAMRQVLATEFRTQQHIHRSEHAAKK